MTRGWAAGLFDGEGTINIRRAKPSASSGEVSPRFFVEVAISVTHRPTLVRFKDQFGGHVHQVKADMPNRRPIWTWHLVSRKACQFLEFVRPELFIKAAEADVAIAFYAMVVRETRMRAQGGHSVGGRARGGRRLSDPEIASRDGFRQKLYALPGRGGRARASA
jgi:hypothetical protein